VRRASFALLWSLARHDKAAGDEQFLATFDLIEHLATDECPLVTKSISMALRALGKRNEVLRQAVLATATRLSDSRTGPASRIGRTALRDFG
jgi:3-methyladenine DNA glycosylase AlkD